MSARSSGGIGKYGVALNSNNYRKSRAGLITAKLMTSDDFMDMPPENEDE